MRGTAACRRRCDIWPCAGCRMGYAARMRTCEKDCGSCGVRARALACARFRRARALACARPRLSRRPRHRSGGGIRRIRGTRMPRDPGAPARQGRTAMWHRCFPGHRDATLRCLRRPGRAYHGHHRPRTSGAHSTRATPVRERLRAMAAETMAIIEAPLSATGCGKGSSPLRMVPCPGCERTWRAPPSAASRSAIPCRPVPCRVVAVSNPPRRR